MSHAPLESSTVTGTTTNAPAPRPTQAETEGEFWKLICRRRDVNLTAVALEIATDHDPACDPERTLRWLKDRAREARGPIAAAADGRAALTALADVLCGDHELCGGEAAFDSPDGSLIHRVVEAGTGLPILLSLVYMDVARRVGLELVGVNAPHHFLTRLDTAAGPLFCDPYHGGRVMDEEETIEFLMERCDLAPAEIADSLRPAAPRAVVVRVLNNLKAIHARQGDWPAAWTVQTRLSALCPADYTERRDLALIALHAGRAGQAVDLLTALISDAPLSEKPVLKRHLNRAAAQVSKWN
ncbi:SirB1 family protein [Alienimonas chondri]|uniref:Protein SirB1 N-terminal domain-containing protein n=1 Tax=Alienimonas chondri TaxID=2681879 RepID=A0ABX1VH29_9PLAN|nr:transglutaminase-like domain-containing protein [Alienimonas chondri]NNJ27433.1 hypothetical protein [Alienimonas chondri]